MSVLQQMAVNIKVIAVYRDFPDGSVAKDSVLLRQGAQVQSLVMELDPVCHNWKIPDAATMAWCSQN